MSSNSNNNNMNSATTTPPRTQGFSSTTMPQTPLASGGNPTATPAGTSNTDSNNRSIPLAAYPPSQPQQQPQQQSQAQQRYPSRSSLRSSPHYSFNTSNNTASSASAGLSSSLLSNSSYTGEQHASSYTSSENNNNMIQGLKGSSSVTQNRTTVVSSSPAATPSIPLRPQVRFCQAHMLASINTVDNNNNNNKNNNPHQETKHTSASSNPLLLEIAHVRHDRQTQSFHRTVVAQSRHDYPSAAGQQQQQHRGQGQSAAGTQQSSSMHNKLLASTCMDVASSTTTNESSNSINASNLVAPIATGLTNGALCVHTVASTEAASTTEIDSTDNSSMLFDFHRHYFAAPRASTSSHYAVRPVTAVAWKPHASWVAVAWNATASATTANSSSTNNPNSPTALSDLNNPQGSAISGVNAASSSINPSGNGGTGGNAALSGTNNSAKASSTRLSDKEYGCFVWDVQQRTAGSGRGGTKPIFKLSHQMGVASLAWLHPSTLIVGGQLRNAHLYDLRAQSSSSTNSATSQAMATVYAHNFSVSGIEADPQRSHRFATFCSVANEPVKIWDSRRMDTFVQEIKIGSGTFAKGDDSHACYASAVQWSTRESGILSVAVASSIYDFDTSSSNSRPLGVGSYDIGQHIRDFCLYPYKSFDEESKLEDWVSSLYSRRAIVVPEDRSLLDVAKHRLSPLAVSSRDGRLAHSLGRTLWVGQGGTGPMGMESSQIHAEEDISATMKRRAGCLHTVKYSMDASSNIKMLAEDGIMAQQQTSSVTTTRDGLLRLWVWIERIEGFCSDGDEATDSGLLLWPVKGLLDAGALRLLNIGGQQRNSDEVEEYCDPLSCPVYDSPGRRAALAACGWTGKFDLNNIMGECEELDEFERSAALAVWHGDIGSAVSALQRGASSIRASAEKKAQDGDKTKTYRYAETLELVSLCIAGYRGGTDTPSSNVWRQACANLMERNDLSGVNRSSARAAYLSALLRFLTAPDVEKAHKEILSDGQVSLSDRIGFACKFLPKDELQSTLLQFVSECQNRGNIEGLIITGIEKKGIKILQAYVDHHSDIQTAALVTSRVILPSTWVNERRICNEWLDTYRTLLNTWQMWQSRALFDVDRAKLLRKLKAKQQSEGGPKNKKRLTHESDIQAPVPASLMIRCNFCNSPLLTKTKDGASMEKLSKMKSVLSCCPTCRKPLPRCAVCMLSLGTTNPYHELVRRMTGSEESSNSNLPFAEWFAWCMRCKHGGHAHHMVGWFANHETCPVSGCGCRCQFDGIQKLRRASSKPSATECIPVSDGEEKTVS